MPPAFFAATWEGVRTGLAQGLSGWAIPDARVVLTHTGYWPRQSAMHQKFNKNVSSVGADFRNLAPVLVHDALRQARTVVCEPVETFHLDIPAGALPVVTVTLARLSGLVTGTEPRRRGPDADRHDPHQKRPATAGAAPRADQRRGRLHLGGDPLHPGRGPAPCPPENRSRPPGPGDWFRARPR